MATIVPSGKKLVLQVQFLDANGNPATVHGVPVWASADETFFTMVDVAADGMSAKAQHMGQVTAPGQMVQVTCTADADLGDGVRNVIAMLELEAVAGEAVSASIVAGALEDIA